MYAAPTGQALTCDLKDLRAHLDDVDAGLEFFRLPLDHVGAFRDGIGNRRPSLWAQANETAQLGGINAPCVELVERLKQGLDVSRQPISCGY